jgi:WD40 repeat protein
LVKAVEDGAISQDTVISITDANRKEHQQHTHVSFGITMVGVSNRVAVHRAEQQLNIENKLKLLDRDVARASSLSKSKVDTLTDLEKRILDMKSQLRQFNAPSVNEEIRADLRTDNTVQINKNFSECPKCKKRVLVAMLSAHEKQCNVNKISLTKEILLIENRNEKQCSIFEAATFPPGVPRNSKLQSKGCNFIEWYFEAPVTDGGLLITDYEIKYEGKYQEMDASTNKWRKEQFVVPSLLTSRWALQRPIAENGFRIMNLRSETEYFNFYIRCMNPRGYSDWVSMGDEGAIVRTSDTERPSVALFFECKKITSSCLYLQWDPPWFTGGQEIVEYIVYYTVAEREISVQSREVMMEKDKVFATGSSECSVVLRNIMSDSEVIKIFVQCKNKAGLLSDKLKLSHNCRTEKCSRHMELQRQLHIASKITDQEFIDTDFFSGIQQRVPLSDFIADCKKYLLQTDPTDEEADEARIWGGILEKIETDRRIRAELDEMAEKIKRGELAEEVGREEEDESESEDSEDEGVIAKKKDIALKKSFIFTNAQRRRHYEKKMRRTENLIEELTKEKHTLDMNRSRLAIHMQTTQTRQMMLKVERDRLSNYNSEYVASSVIHGYEVQYLLEDFLDAVEIEYDKCQTEISTTKLKVMNGEKRKADIKVRLEELAELLKERRAAYLQFETRCKSTFKSLARLQGLSGIADSNLKPHYFGQWRKYIEDRQSVRRKVTQTFQGLLLRFKSSAFIKWKTGEFEMDSKDSSLFFGVGSKLLQEAKEQRIQLQGLLREAIAGTNNIRQTVNMVSLTRENRKLLTTSTVYRSVEEGMDHVKLAEGNLRFLYEADGYVSLGKFDLAYRMYEAQIIYIRAMQPLTSMQIRQLSMVHGRQGRMFAMMEKFDRAILEFDRQLSLAREVEDKAEEANAYFGIGFGYMKRFVYEDAIRYLDIAQGKFAALGLTMKRVAALRSLLDCFDRIGKVDSVKMYEERIQHIEGETAVKMSLIDKKLGLMKERLVHTTADIELVIKIERTTLKSLQLRNKISEMTAKQKEYQKQKKVYEDVMKGLSETLDAIAAELKEAFETDELEMWSKLVQDTPQLVDVEELKTRLAARKTAELANFDREKVEFDRLAKLIANLEDDLEAADDNLKLEEGALMTRSRHDKPFRCIAFCAANAAGNEVTGTATGGVEHFLSAEGNNVHVIDHHNGGLVTVLVGDNKNRVGEKTGHVGVVTCLVHDGSQIFSGSVDETVISWDAVTHKKLLLFRGHEGSIVSLAVDGPHLASGSADTTIRIWDKFKGTQLRVVFGHSKSVTSIEMGPSWLLTGSADEEVRVWAISRKHKHTLTVDCRCRLVGHETGITCVRFGKLEVVSGDVQGRIFLWWTESSAILRQMQVHKGSVKCIQFDAIHIVSGGVDNCVCITDIATGDVLQSLRGHEGHVLAVSFDTERILSASGDNTIRFWSWGKKSLPEDKIHVLNHGETLVAVAKIYDITVNELALWNGISGVRQLYPGMNLIVRKGDPSAPTAAEKMAADRARRIEQAKGMVAGKFREEGVIGNALSYDRIQRLATDFDHHSLGNRLFSTQKIENELFPDSWDPNVDLKSLASRLKQKDAREASLQEDLPEILIVEGNEGIFHYTIVTS